MSDGSNGGTFTPSVGSTGVSSVVVTPTNGLTSFTFTYTPATVGDKTITLTNGQAWTNPASISYTSDISDPDSPILSTVSASTTSTGATITWTTDEISSSIVDYGLTNSYGASTVEEDTSPRVTSHSVDVSSLVACTTYHYRVRSTDGASNTATGSDNTFTTTGCTGSADVLDEETSSITGATGGTVELDLGGAGLLLTIPAGATDDDAVYQIKQLDGTTVVNSIGTPSGVILAGSNTFELKSLSDVDVANTSFNEAITLTLSYEDADVLGIDESTLVIYRWDGATWTALTDCVVDTNANTVTCTTTHFSLFGLFGGASASSSRSSSGSRRVVLAQANTTPCLPGHLFNSSTGLPCSTTTTATPSTETFTFTKTLKSGMTDIEVKELQKYLNTHGYVLTTTGAGSPNNETNLFGKLTKLAVIKFQTANKLVADGIVGPMTRGKMR